MARFGHPATDDAFGVEWGDRTKRRCRHQYGKHLFSPSSAKGRGNLVVSPFPGFPVYDATGESLNAPKFG
jgi:hypothetical protein